MTADIPAAALWLLIVGLPLLMLVAIARWRRQLGRWPMPPGCICAARDWSETDQGLPVPPACEAFVDCPDDEYLCDRCEHCEDCHAD